MNLWTVCGSHLSSDHIFLLSSAKWFVYLCLLLATFYLSTTRFICASVAQTSILCNSCKVHTLMPRMRPILLTNHLVKFICIKIKPISVQTQLNSIYYTEVHPSNCLWSVWGSQLVFKTFWGWNILFKSIKTCLNLLKINKIVKVINWSNVCEWRFYRQLLQILFTYSAYFVIAQGQLTQRMGASSQTNLVLQILTAPTSVFVNAVRICKSFTVHGMINVKILY